MTKTAIRQPWPHRWQGCFKVWLDFNFVGYNIYINQMVCWCLDLKQKFVPSILEVNISKWTQYETKSIVHVLLKMCHDCIIRIGIITTKVSHAILRSTFKIYDRQWGCILLELIVNDRKVWGSHTFPNKIEKVIVSQIRNNQRNFYINICRNRYWNSLSTVAFPKTGFAVYVWKCNSPLTLIYGVDIHREFNLWTYDVNSFFIEMVRRIQG